MFDVRSYNRDAWDREVANGNEWTRPVTPEQVARARQGDWQLVMTPLKPVPAAWWPPIAGARILGLAAGGGQQGPLLAAAGGRVTVFDNSPAQLAQDRLVAERDGLALETLEGDMRDLSRFADGSFDLIVHPCSNCFVPEILPVWREAARVLRPGGVLIAGFCNPVSFLVDPDLDQRGVAQLRYAMPYSDLTSLTDAERARYTDAGEPLAFGHSLEDQLAGQLRAGLVLTDLYEDGWTADKGAIHAHLPCFMATRATKP